MNVIDVHAHIFPYRGVENDKAEIRQAMDLYHISRVYISCLDSMYPSEKEINDLNDHTYDFCKEDPKRLRPYCYINPALSNAVDALRYGVEEHGAVGVKLWVAALCDNVLVNRIAEACIEYSIPLLIHAFQKYNGILPDENTGYNIATLANRYPEAKIIMAHLGGDAYHGIKPVRNCMNVWTDFSGTNFRAGELEYTVKLLGAERVLFGTDMPPAPFLTNLGIVEDADISESDKQDILWRNACKLFDDPLDDIEVTV